MATGTGSGYRWRSRLKRSHFIHALEERRSSHFLQTRTTSYHLYRFAGQIDWAGFDQAFGSLYSEGTAV